MSTSDEFIVKRTSLSVTALHVRDDRIGKRRRHVRHNIHSLSRSTPALNQVDTFPVPRSQRKFLRRFKDLDTQELIVKSFSCALVSDILLQGRLYVTEQHFAFYSNLFGHITRILIPCSLVLDITKEKTARFIPNAVAVLSRDGRHVFGSLLSRDSAFETMNRVWRQQIGLESESPELSFVGKEDVTSDVEEPLVPPAVFNDLFDTSDENDSANESATPPPIFLPSSESILKHGCVSMPTAGATVDPTSQIGSPSVVLLACDQIVSALAGGLYSGLAGARSHRLTLLLLFGNLLLLLLFCASYSSLNRIEEIQRRIQQPLIRLDSTDLDEADKTLSHHLRQLAMVRRSLEALSSLTDSYQNEPA